MPKNYPAVFTLIKITAHTQLYMGCKTALEMQAIIRFRNETKMKVSVGCVYEFNCLYPHSMIIFNAHTVRFKLYDRPPA